MQTYTVEWSDNIFYIRIGDILQASSALHWDQVGHTYVMRMAAQLSSLQDKLIYITIMGVTTTHTSL